MRSLFRTRGLSLMELLVTIVIASIAVAAAGRAFSESLRFEEMSARSRDGINDRVRVEDTLTRLIAGASLHGSTGFFISPVPASAAGLDAHAGSSLGGSGSSSLVLTSTSVVAPATALSGAGQEFTDLNQRFGGLGGTAEVAFSLTPVGDAGGLTGLFLREQRPPDGNPSQGGDESLLSPAIRDIRFQFWDGSQWQPAWDSKGVQKGLLPMAVRVTYLFGEDDVPHGLLVRLPLAPGGAK